MGTRDKLVLWIFIVAICLAGCVSIAIVKGDYDRGKIELNAPDEEDEEDADPEEERE